MTKKNRIKQNPPRVWNDPTSHPKKGGEVGLETLGSDRGAGAAAGRGWEEAGGARPGSLFPCQ